MNFLVDAQLPRRLTYRLQEAGHDAIHTLDLPDGNSTTDEQINLISIDEQRVVVTKDDDFVHSFQVSRRPPKLLLVSTSNISNATLEALLLQSLPAIVDALLVYDFVELSRDSLLLHQ
jgi:predicted nuclease of predicted toxin-antitoxin system